MKVVGNELSIFSFMFASGTAAGIFLTGIPAVSTVSFYAAVLFALASKLSLKTCLITIAGAFFFAGLAGSSATLSLDGTSGKSRLTEKTASVSAALKDCIDSIPFEEKNSNAVIKAFITGDKRSLPTELTIAFRKSGASHLLALSGLHLGILYLILTRILAILGNSPTAVRIKSIISILSAGFYTVMTGAGPSILRAFLFICINETGKCLKRENFPLNTFSIALLIHLLLEPGNIKHAGFQLSYAAMAGIYLLHPHIKKWYSIMNKLFIKEKTNKTSHDSIQIQVERIQIKSNLIQKLWNTLSLTLSCQIFTAPVAWLHFGSFPSYFLITNLTAAPLTVATINLSIPVIILQAIGVCPKYVAWILEIPVNLLIDSIEIIASL